jgi:predicted dienelactone hydrolase
MIRVNRPSMPFASAGTMAGRVIAAAMILVLGPAAGPAQVGQGYDPLAIPPGAKVRTVDLTVRDDARGRDIPLRVYLPDANAPAPVVLFSHGLGGTCKGNTYLGNHWAGRGYVAVFVQHPGSDDGIWRDKPLLQRMAAMQQAASAANSMLRVQDIPAVLDQLRAWNALVGHALNGRLDLQRVGMSGHSFGAVTTQAVSGQSFGRAGRQFTDKRIKAAVMFSPSPPRQGDAAGAFSSVPVPWMLMTGTQDESPIGGVKAPDRLNVYPYLPAKIDRYELVLDKAEHSAFSQGALPGDRGKRNPNHHRVILALTTAFWDTHLRGDPAARAWLHGAAARGVLEKDDRWQVGNAKPDATTRPETR